MTKNFLPLSANHDLSAHSAGFRHSTGIAKQALYLFLAASGWHIDKALRLRFDDIDSEVRTGMLHFPRNRRPQPSPINLTSNRQSGRKSHVTQVRLLPSRFSQYFFSLIKYLRSEGNPPDQNKFVFQHSRKRRKRMI